MRFTLAWSAGLLVSLALAACGSTSSTTGAPPGSTHATASTGSHPVSVGTRTIQVTSPKPDIALFIAGTSNQYLQTWAATASSYGHQLGLKLTVFNGNFDASTQYDQMQNALQSKQYNAWLVISLDGNLDCKIMSQSAPAAGIVVVAADTAICNRATLPFANQWQPGTVSFVSGENSIDYLRGWLNAAASKLPGQHNIGFLTGPAPPVPTTVALDDVLKKFEPEHPDLHFVDVVPTDYTTANALALTQTMLQAHPDIDTILSIYSDDTRGAIQALSEARKLGKVTVVDVGASGYSVSEVKAGHVLFTIPYTPVNSAKGAIKSLLAAWSGHAGPRTVDVFPPNNGSVEHPLIIDKGNAAAYKTQY